MFHCALRLPNSSTSCFPFLRCEAMATVTNWPLHVQYGITLWANLSESLVKDNHKRLSSMEKPHYRVLQVTWSHITVMYVLRKVYGNIVCEENGWLSHGKFIILLTFELSSFRENGFLVLLDFLRCSCWHLWTPKSTRRQNRENGHTHTDTTGQPGHVHRELIILNMACYLVY